MPRLLSNKSPKKISEVKSEIEKVSEPKPVMKNENCVREHFMGYQWGEKTIAEKEATIRYLMSGGRRDYNLWQFRLSISDREGAEKYYKIMKENKLKRDREKFEKKMQRLDKKYFR